jgi:hypothetical protein
MAMSRAILRRTAAAPDLAPDARDLHVAPAGCGRTPVSAIVVRAQASTSWDMISDLETRSQYSDDEDPLVHTRELSGFPAEVVAGIPLRDEAAR